MMGVGMVRDLQIQTDSAPLLVGVSNQPFPGDLIRLLRSSWSRSWM